MMRALWYTTGHWNSWYIKYTIHCYVTIRISDELLIRPTLPQKQHYQTIHVV